MGSPAKKFRGSVEEQETQRMSALRSYAVTGILPSFSKESLWEGRPQAGVHASIV
jgi:hypothetical protein